MGKIFERIIFRKISTRLNIREEQHAFRKGHSINTQLITVVYNLSKSTNERKKMIAVFLGVAKAFDRVWHQGLIHKLIHSNILYHIVKLIAFFLNNHFFCI